MFATNKLCDTNNLLFNYKVKKTLKIKILVTIFKYYD